jgi:hypothetical protein
MGQNTNYKQMNQEALSDLFDKQARTILNLQKINRNSTFLSPTITAECHALGLFDIETELSSATNNTCTSLLNSHINTLEAEQDIIDKLLRRRN